MGVSGKNLKLGTSEAVLPSGYLLKYIEMENFRGEVRDIQNIVIKFSITESLYSPTLTLNLSVKDSSNFIEEFPVLGMEMIRLRLEYVEYDTQIPKEIELEFFVTEYPTFGRPQEQHVQVWSLIGVSEQAYLSAYKKISRSFSGNTASEIEKICVRDLALPSDRFELIGEPISKAQGIINIQHPLSAIEWFRSKTFDADFTPFYFFQRLDGKYNLVSHDYLVDINRNPRYQTYYDSRGFSTEALTPEDYAQRITRVLSMTSTLKLSKLAQAHGGAYASRHMYVDYATKSYRYSTYDYLAQFQHEKTLETEEVLSKLFGVQGTPLNQYPNAYNEYISTNRFAYDNALSNINGLTESSRHKLNAYASLFNTYTHDISLHGDFKLNPGRRIEVKIPKAIDPQVYQSYTGKSPEKLYDDWMSADYLITSIIHKFENSEYYVDLRVKRDSFTLDIDSYGQ